MRDLGGRASHHASPLRYPGGKAKLAPYLKRLVRSNDLLDGLYVEPFAGGGAVGLCLLLHGYVDRIILNDLSTPIYAFWRAILDEPERFQDRILRVELTTEEWLNQRRIFQEADGDISFDVGFATFFLNRTNHSGVLNAGMIGGLRQQSAYGLDARFNRQELAARVKRIARSRSKITALNLDAAELIGNVQTISGDRRPLLYIDPPYYRKGRDLYYDYYKPDDHRALRDVILQLQPTIPWVVSYDNEPEIVDLYRDNRAIKYNLSYSVPNGRMGNEIMFFWTRFSRQLLSIYRCWACKGRLSWIWPSNSQLAEQAAASSSGAPLRVVPPLTQKLQRLLACLRHRHRPPDHHEPPGSIPTSSPARYQPGQHAPPSTRRKLLLRPPPRIRRYTPAAHTPPRCSPRRPPIIHWSPSTHDAMMTPIPLQNEGRRHQCSTKNS